MSNKPAHYWKMIAELERRVMDGEPPMTPAQTSEFLAEQQADGLAAEDPARQQIEAYNAKWRARRAKKLERDE